MLILPQSEAEEGLSGQHWLFLESPQLTLRSSVTEIPWAKGNTLVQTPHPHRVPACQSAPVPRGPPGEDGYDATLVS